MSSLAIRALQPAFLAVFLWLSWLPAALADELLFVHLVLSAVLLRGNIPVFLMILFGLTYPLFHLVAERAGLMIHYLQPLVTASQIDRVFALQGVFWSCLLFVAGARKPVLVFDSAMGRDRVVARAMNLVCALVVVHVVAFGLANRVLGIGGAYGAESASSILLEYVLIPQIFSLFYLRDPRNTMFVTLVALGVIVGALLLGRRLPAVMQGILLLLLHARNRSFAFHLAVFGAGFLAMSLVAILRIDGAVGNGAAAVLLNVNEAGVMENNQGGVIYSSAAYVQLWERGVFDVLFGLRSFGNMALSVILPSSLVDTSAFLNFAAMQHLPIPGNGGLVSVSFFARLGVAGVILGAVCLGAVLRRTGRSHAACLYATFLAVTFPRWQSYNINILVKMGALLLFTYFLIFALKSVQGRRTG